MAELENFTKGTDEYEFEVDKRKYIVRYVLGDTCCESPWSEQAWPLADLAEEAEEEDDDAEEAAPESKQSVIGGVWLTDNRKLIAVWGHDDEGHVEFYGVKDYEFLEDLSALSGELCGTVCPPLADVFDDGSGQDREIIPVRGLNCPVLEGFFESSTGSTKSAAKTKESKARPAAAAAAQSGGKRQRK